MKQKRGLQKSKLNNYLDEEIKQLRSQYETISCEKQLIKRFQDLPLSQKTLKGLDDAKLFQPTEIQRKSIVPALQGKDVLGAAVTGSGKTLAFLIPVLEHLYMAKWSRADGVAAIIISPTRELAYQIFGTVNKIGKYHDFSVGLIIGGKNLKFERTRMDQCNILICTPGRLLQHMDENPLFNASTMEILVLDEADRCLDMGFEQTLNAILENFPSDRQTLLFSATQTSSVKDLARLNLKNAVYIGEPQSTDEMKNDAKIVPDLLQQNYVVVKLEDKITMLWSFIKNHLKQKIIVFLSSCKQVKYIYDIFCKLKPGTSLLALHGRLHQDRRIAIYMDFIRKNNVVLFATDIASRGLDFPSVNWVVQLDCPEDVTQYIHRAGRSARNMTRGESLLVLLPSEEKEMIDALNRKCLNIRKIQIDPKKLFSPCGKIESFLAQNPELKASAQRAFVAYIKSVFLMKNKRIFNVLALNFCAYAKSLGLAVTPRIRFLDRYIEKNMTHRNKEIDNMHSKHDEVFEFRGAKSGQRKLLNEIQTQGESELLFKASDINAVSDDDDDFIKIKRANHEILNDQNKNFSDKQLTSPLLSKKVKLVTKAALAKKMVKKKLLMNEKVKFDEEGREITDARKQLQSKLAKEYDNEELSLCGIDINMAKQLLQEEDKFDKQRFRKLVQQRHKALKEKLKIEPNKDTGIIDQESEYDNIDSEDDDTSADLSGLPHSFGAYNRKTKRTVTSPKHKKIQQSESSSSEDYEDFGVPLPKKSKVDLKLSLNDAEVIAEQLLAKSV